MKNFFICFAFLLFAFALSLAVGAAGFHEQIIFNFRLPKSLTAIFAGAALSVSGLLMQALFRNPLADPFVLGVSAGGSLGAAFVVLMGAILPVGVVGGAWFGSAASMLLVLWAARRVRDAGSLLVIGVMIGYIVSALVSVMINFSRAERVQGFVIWSFGSFSGVGWDRLAILAPLIIFALGASFLLGKPLNAMLLGENSARSLGVDVRKIRVFSISLTAILSGTVTAFCGPVAFIGLAVPHLCRTISRSGDHTKLIPLCIVIGGALALLAESATQSGLPLNSVTSIIGAPFVIHALISTRRGRG